MRRRSVSSCDSPGPRKPIPPFVVQNQQTNHGLNGLINVLTEQVQLVIYLHGSARWAKISKMRPVRSITRHFKIFSKLRSWAGLMHDQK